ncbi:MAG: energy transducer TonB [Pseudohongiellaceae bacterium]
MTEDRDLRNERFGFMVFLSGCLHAMLILGVGFSYLEELNSEPAMEITLAQYRSEQAPDEADFLAQENQTGSGSLDEMVAPASPFQSDFHAQVIQEVAPLPSTTAASVQPTEQDISVLTTQLSPEQLRQQLDENNPNEETNQAEQTNPEELSMAIASLQAQLDLQRQAYAKRPRRYTISSASTRRSHDALYLDAWRKRIETVGNLNYPGRARVERIFGSLRLMVAILPNGTVDEVKILQSSGHTILDQAAIEIINLAAPFDPFPEELRGEVDILEVIRTWRFHEGNAFTSSGN